MRASATSGAFPGQYALTVRQLATAQQQVKPGLGALSMTVGAGRSYLTAGPLVLDLSAAPAGVQDVEVTRSSAPAAVYGTPLAALPPGATDLTVAVDGGAPATLSLTGDYRDPVTLALDPARLAQDVNDQLAAQGVAATASVVGGRLRLATSAEGSARTLQLGGGAAGALGLSTTQARGQAALVTVNGKTQDVEPTATPGFQALGTSGVSLQVGPSLRTGSTKANVVVTTDTTTLADLQSMLNTTGSPASAALVAAADGSRSLVLSSTATGTQGRLTVTAGTPVLSGLAESTPARDAEVTVNGIDVVRSSNTLTDVLPGLTLSLLSKPADGAARTVTVARDSAGHVRPGRGLVDTLNLFLGKIASDTKYDVKAKTGGPLVGDATARGTASQLFSTAATAAGAGSIRALSQLGIETTRDGKFAFKADVFAAALARDPDGVAKTVAGLRRQRRDLRQEDRRDRWPADRPARRRAGRGRRAAEAGRRPGGPARRDRAPLQGAVRRPGDLHGRPELAAHRHGRRAEQLHRHQQLTLDG